MGGSSSSEKESEEHNASDVEITTKKTMCTTISGGKRSKRSRRIQRTHHKRSHSKRRHPVRHHSRRR